MSRSSRVAKFFFGPQAAVSPVILGRLAIALSLSGAAERFGDSAAQQEAEFVSWVRGNLGTRWYAFRIRHRWSAGGGGAGTHTGIDGGAPPTQLDVVGGYRCAGVK